MHLLFLDQFLVSRLALKAGLTDIDYVFFSLLRPEWITVDMVYSVHWSSVHTTG